MWLYSLIPLKIKKERREKMLRKQTLTVIELKSLILARFNADKSKQVKLQVRLQQEFGNEVEEKKPEDIAIENKFADLTSGVLARRLKRNRRATPLLSSRDFVRFVLPMISEIAKKEGNQLEVEERKMLEKLVKTMFENLSEKMYTMIPPRKNIYEEYWRWVTTVLDLAAERGVLPIELLTLEEATDEITRRMFTKRQFIALCKRTLNKFMDADVLKKSIIQPILDMVAEGDEEERRELEKEIEVEIMPQLRENVEKSKAVINTFFGEEAKRIYATA